MYRYAALIFAPSSSAAGRSGVRKPPSLPCEMQYREYFKKVFRVRRVSATGRLLPLDVLYCTCLSGFRALPILGLLLLFAVLGIVVCLQHCLLFRHVCEKRAVPTTSGGEVVSPPFPDSHFRPPPLPTAGNEICATRTLGRWRGNAFFKADCVCPGSYSTRGDDGFVVIINLYIFPETDHKCTVVPWTGTTSCKLSICAQ